MYMNNEYHIELSKARLIETVIVKTKNVFEPDVGIKIIIIII